MFHEDEMKKPADPGEYIPFGSLCGSLAAANMDENGRVYSLIVCNIVSLGIFVGV